MLIIISPTPSQSLLCCQLH